MAYETVIGCDLCDAISAADDTDFCCIEGKVAGVFGGNEVGRIEIGDGSNGATLCVKCAAPFLKVIDDLRERSGIHKKRPLRERVRAAVEGEKI